MEIGGRIGDYEILAVLGAGGMGKVYKVRNIHSDRVEAMKVLLPELVGDPESGDRFLREIKVLGALEHPNIARQYTAQCIDGTFIMVMEYVDGVPLDSLVKESALTVSETIGCIIQVLNALAYAHSRKKPVTHRDIKPANIMRAHTGEIKLMDFGLARMKTDQKLTRTGQAPGSLYYMAPEQIRGDEPDPRSDIYSLGVSLYEMVTGRPPFKGESAYSIMQGHLSEQPIPPIEIASELPIQLNTVILKALAKAPDERYQTAESFRAALESIDLIGTSMSLGGTTVSDVADTLAAPATSTCLGAPPAPSGKRSLYMALGAVLSLGVLFVGAVQGPKLLRSGTIRAVSEPASSALPDAPVPSPGSSVGSPSPLSGRAGALSAPAAAYPRRADQRPPSQELAQQQPTRPTVVPPPPVRTEPGGLTAGLAVPVDLSDKLIRLRAEATAFESELKALNADSLKSYGVPLHSALSVPLSIAQARLNKAEKEVDAGAYADARGSLDAAEEELHKIAKRIR